MHLFNDPEVRKQLPDKRGYSCSLTGISYQEKLDFFANLEWVGIRTTLSVYVLANCCLLRVVCRGSVQLSTMVGMEYK